MGSRIDDYYSELIAIWKTENRFMNALLGSSILGYNQQAVNRPPLSILETEPTATFVVTPVPVQENSAPIGPLTGTQVQLIL